MADYDDKFGGSPYKPRPDDDDRDERLNAARLAAVARIGAAAAENVERHSLYRRGLLTVAMMPDPGPKPPDPGVSPGVSDLAALIAYNAACERMRVYRQRVADREWLRADLAASKASR